MQTFIQMQQLLPFALHQLGNGNPGPAFNNFGDFLLCDPVAEQALLSGILCQTFFLLQLLLCLGQLAIFELCRRLQIVCLLRLFDLCFIALN